MGTVLVAGELGHVLEHLLVERCRDPGLRTNPAHIKVVGADKAAEVLAVRDVRESGS